MNGLENRTLLLKVASKENMALVHNLYGYSGNNLYVSPCAKYLCKGVGILKS